MLWSLKVLFSNSLLKCDPILYPYFLFFHRLVVETEPAPYCIVAPDTVIHCEGEPIKREVTFWSNF